MIDIMAILLIFFGLFFFLSGSIGLLRLPDVFSRLHALAKADNIGLAFVTLGVIMLEPNILNDIKVVIIWLLVMAASAISSHLIARRALREHRGDD
ncbi:MAG: monovalent cation/H(+) antiporter subunit G [Gammaproteobacteria bacterium]|nr:monovalent cation/H(+) antiporter subunit G [Gammaproteobacteria bacterium]MBT8133337.1 monovalent cation/H(+) antiporter subunit G [Gammaproteobacteria bacterium]NNJ51031.1 monovalent cation/H(+) antiporter subunit G [Gammaproteobacteria bacterium]